MIELDVKTNEGTVTLQFEHSLRSLSKWESKTRKAWFGSAEKLPSEMILYFQCMLLSPGVDPDLVYACSAQQLDDLAKYINESFTASSVPDDTKSKIVEEIATSELIYYWMTALKINWEAQDWHLSRLMMLIKISSYKQQPPKKRKEKDVLADWAAQNEKQKKLLGITG